MMLSASRVVTSGAAIVPLRALGPCGPRLRSPRVRHGSRSPPAGRPPAPQSWGEHEGGAPGTLPADRVRGAAAARPGARVLLPPGLGGGGAPRDAVVLAG